MKLKELLEKTSNNQSNTMYENISTYKNKYYLFQMIDDYFWLYDIFDRIDLAVEQRDLYNRTEWPKKEKCILVLEKEKVERYWKELSVNE